MAQSRIQQVGRGREGLRQVLLRKSNSWMAAMLALVGLYGLAQALIQPINQLTRPGGEVLVDGSGGAPVEFLTWDLPVGFSLLSETEFVFSGLALCLGAWMLRNVLRSISAGEPFDRRNPRRLRWLALAVLAGTTLAPLATYWCTRAVLAYVGSDATAHLPLDLWGPLGLGDIGLTLVVLAAAEAFQQGRQLTDDADGLI